MKRTKSVIASVSIISAATCCAMAPYAKFGDGMLSKTRPAGWLMRACRMQADGLSGHPEALSYPYDSCLWAGSIPRMGKHGAGWWRYEQTAYYTDGILRLGYATGDEALIKKGEAGIDYTLDHASPKGYLGDECLWNRKKHKVVRGMEMWPMVVFFRAMKAKYDASPDPRIPAALAKYYRLYSSKAVSLSRNTISVEGMLWTYGKTGDAKLLELAEQAWLRKVAINDWSGDITPAKCESDEPLFLHGASYCEELKIPLILYAYTGKKEYLNQAVNVERKLVRDHILPDGCPESTEHVRGNSVYWGHETCDVSDYSWSLGYFLETTGDASYADKIERCVYNAAFGAMADDFRSLQYFSNLNQFICTSNSDHNPHKYGTTWMQYRPTHETECCAGQINRIVPNFISRMWLKDAEGRPVAALYGPSEVDFGWAKISEETRYPFDGKIVFRFSMKEPRESAFTYRVPGWCKKGASVKVNGESVSPAKPGAFATIARKFSDGDTIELDFPMEVRFEELPSRHLIDPLDVKTLGLKHPAPAFANSSQGTVVYRGPLIYAYPIPFERTEDAEIHANMRGKKSANPDFKCWNLRPAGPFNYALAAHTATVSCGADAGDGFFKNPAAVKIRVPVRRIKWELSDNLDKRTSYTIARSKDELKGESVKDRFTPDLPENPVVLPGEEEAIELVPYGSAMLRIGVFPDVSKVCR